MFFSGLTDERIEQLKVKYVTKLWEGEYKDNV